METDTIVIVQKSKYT